MVVYNICLILSFGYIEAFVVAASVSANLSAKLFKGTAEKRKVTRTFCSEPLVYMEDQLISKAHPFRQQSPSCHSPALEPETFKTAAQTSLKAATDKQPQASGAATSKTGDQATNTTTQTAALVHRNADDEKMNVGCTNSRCTSKGCVRKKQGIGNSSVRKQSIGNGKSMSSSKD